MGLVIGKEEPFGKGFMTAGAGGAYQNKGRLGPVPIGRFVE